MDTRESLKRLEETVDYYLEQLEGIAEEPLSRKPSEEEWSIGQLYVHLIQSSRFMNLRHIGLCQEGNDPAIVVGGVKNEAGFEVFRNSGFSDVKIHVPPSPQYTPKQPDGKAELNEGMRALVLSMKEIEPKLQEIPPEHTVLHPRLGALNAEEWFKMVEIHFGHHLKQLRRLQQFIGAGAS
ncbi:DinB family protein [Cohnella herbarum]|uniref:DinB family protein n=1 Tax=Cohnella herbarum TaxID=2728023 RepID=A0A7Z2ZMJ2_9BACL|nr:DinB family protein [Cohnella herbarum]QJD85431.1 DinB family protein [Cohnella herbarum]